MPLPDAQPSSPGQISVFVSAELGTRVAHSLGTLNAGGCWQCSEPGLAAKTVRARVPMELPAPRGTFPAPPTTRLEGQRPRVRSTWVSADKCSQAVGFPAWTAGWVCQGGGCSQGALLPQRGGEEPPTGSLCREVPPPSQHGPLLLMLVGVPLHHADRHHLQLWGELQAARGCWGFPGVQVSALTLCT